MKIKIRLNGPLFPQVLTRELWRRGRRTAAVDVRVGGTAFDPSVGASQGTPVRVRARMPQGHGVDPAGDQGLVSVAIARPGSQWPLIEVSRPSSSTV
jgi:hypothetical protein